MADFTGLVEIIKQASLDAVSASRPTSVVFGKVVSDDPLKIEIDQKLTLEEPQLILTRNVTDYKVEMTVEHETEDETDHTHDIDIQCPGTGPTPCKPVGTISPTNHKHEYKGRKEFTVHNALVVDDLVLMIQTAGGQKFIVIDRLGGKE